MRPPLLAFCSAVALISAVGCGESPQPDTPWAFVDDPGAPFPADLRDTGLFEGLARGEAPHPRAIPYRPLYELWSNGSSKQRYVLLPEGRAIQTAVRGAWEYPVGTLFIKSFAYPGTGTAEAPTERVVETRFLRRGESAWEYAVYVFSEDQEQAERAPDERATPVAVEIDGERFEHEVPARLDCRKCHESQPSPVIGFDELRLTAPYSDGDEAQLTTLYRTGALSTEMPLVGAERVEHADPVTQDVLGYLQGNCLHCHNGGDGPNSAFDLHHSVALEQLIDQPTASYFVSGTRVVPGSAQDSVLVWMLELQPGADPAETSDTADQPMPPVGVQRADRAAIAMIRSWIDGLVPAERAEE